MEPTGAGMKTRSNLHCTTRVTRNFGSSCKGNKGQGGQNIIEHHSEGKGGENSEIQPIEFAGMPRDL